MADKLTGLEQVLGYEAVTAMVVMYPTKVGPIGDLFPVRNIGGVIGKWDVLKKGRGIALGNVAGGAANRVALQAVGTKTAECIYLNDMKPLPGDFLDRLREPGNSERNARAILANEGQDLRDLHVRTRAALCASALTGTLTFVLSTGQTISIAYGLSGTHAPTASVSWATASTDIIADIKTWKALIEQDAGFTPSRAYVNATVMGYLMNNTAVQKFLGANAYMEMIGKEGRITRLAGLDLFEVNEGYFNGAGTFVPFVADAKFIITPEPGNWAQLQVGTAAVPDGAGGIVMPQSPAGYVVVSEDPVGVGLFEKDNVLPVLLVPDAIVYADVTP